MKRVIFPMAAATLAAMGGPVAFAQPADPNENRLDAVEVSALPLGSGSPSTPYSVMDQQTLTQKNAATLGEYFKEGLRKIDNPKIKEVRGRGLLLAVEFSEDAGGARQYCEKLKDAGLLCKETHETIIRFAPPLVITKGDIDWALERIMPILSE